MLPPRIKSIELGIDWTFTYYPELPLNIEYELKRNIKIDKYKRVLGENILGKNQNYTLKFSAVDTEFKNVIVSLLPDTNQNSNFMFWLDSEQPNQYIFAHWKKEPKITRISGNDLYDITLYIEELY